MYMKYVCGICGYIYDDAKESVKFEDLPDDWKCPMCGAPKSVFEPVIEENSNDDKVEDVKTELVEDNSNNNYDNENLDEEFDEDMRQLSIGQLSILCSNLARGCQKQYKSEEEKLFKEISDYLAKVTPKEENANFDNLVSSVNSDINDLFKSTNATVDGVGDRGAKRSIVWSEKVTRMISSLLSNYQKQGEAMFEGKEIWVCTVCGFIYVGDKLPERCPVCKVPNSKFQKVSGRV